MAASISSRLIENLPISLVKLIFNFWPPFKGAKIRVTHISPDYRAFGVKLKLGWLNRNYAGVHFGGSLFAMVDPFYMLMFSKNLGNQYIVWDKAARIDFKKPGKGTISALCSITSEEIEIVKKEVDRAGKFIFDRSVDLMNEQNEIVATICKTIYVRRKTARI